MLGLASDLIKAVHDRVKVTLQVAAGLAESLGAPPVATAVLQRLGGVEQEEDYYQSMAAEPPPLVTTPVKVEQPEPTPDDKQMQPEPVPEERPAADPEPVKQAAEPKKKAPAKKKRPANKRRDVEGDRSKSENVRALKVEDAINGSTYLARIIWALGVSGLEGIGPLRPADMARMIMSRSPVSLEPPNVARYIRRSKPKCLAVDHKEGSSVFYKLNEQGQSMFEDKYLK